VSARLDGADAPVAIVSESVGVGRLELVRLRSGGLLFYADAQDQLRALPLADSMVPLAAPSVEEGLSTGRPLAESGSILAAFPTDQEKTLSLVTCATP
jgi:hypothetical protein